VKSPHSARCSEDASLSCGALELMAHMAWPYEAPRKKQFLATIGARALAPTRDAFLDEFFGRTTDAGKVRRVLIDQNGGFTVLATAAPYAEQIRALADAMREAFFAGIILNNIFSSGRVSKAAGWGASGSVRGSIVGLESIRHRAAQMPSRTKLTEIWSRRKVVSPICGAVVLVCWSERDYDASDTVEGAELPRGMVRAFSRHFVELIAVSRRLYEFGVRHIPHAQREPLLDPRFTFEPPELPAA
jgi:hypothetical protein